MMDTLAIQQAVRGIVNQAAKNSTRTTGENQKTQKPETEIKLTATAAAELKKRIDQILTQLDKQGVKLETAGGTKTEKQGDTPSQKSSYIDVLRDVLTGNTSVNRLTFDSAAVPDEPLPIPPFDKTFMQANLEFLRGLVSGEAEIDRQLAERIEQQLDELSTQSAPQPPSSEQPASGAAPDKMV